MRYVLERMAKAGRPPFQTLTPAEAREAYEAGAEVLEETKAVLARVEDFHIPARDGFALPARLYAPSADKLPVLLYFHGGGFTIGDLETHDGHCRRLASLAGVRVLAVDYRLAPEHPFPAGHDDALAATKWAFDHADDLGMDPKRIAVGGDSAGGNLTLALLHRIKAAGQPMPACAVMLSPFVDFTLSSPSLVTNQKRDPMFTPSAMVGLRHHYITPEDMLSPDASPLFGDFTGLPPLFFQSSESEMLRDDSLRAAERAHAAGVSVEVELWANVPHVFQGFQALSHGKAALERIADFIARHTNWESTPSQPHAESVTPATASATVPTA